MIKQPLPCFVTGEPLRASDLNLLCRALQSILQGAPGGVGTLNTRSVQRGVKPWTMAGEMVVDGKDVTGEPGGWDVNDSASGIAATDGGELEGSGSASPREYLVNVGATHAREGQDFWRVTEPVRWAAEPEDSVEPAEVEREDDREGDLWRGLWREEANAEGTMEVRAESMFVTMPRPMWVMRDSGAMWNQYGNHQQLVLWPGGKWQAVLLRCVAWYHWDKELLGATRTSWTWGIQAAMDRFGVVRFRSKSEKGLMIPGY